VTLYSQVSGNYASDSKKGTMLKKHFAYNIGKLLDSGFLNLDKRKYLIAMDAVMQTGNINLIKRVLITYPYDTILDAHEKENLMYKLRRNDGISSMLENYFGMNLDDIVQKRIKLALMNNRYSLLDLIKFVKMSHGTELSNQKIIRIVNGFIERSIVDGPGIN